MINADGTASATDTFIALGDGATMCSGALDITDNWTSTETTFAVSAGTCSGSVSCQNGENIPCGPAETDAQTCSYTLSNGNDTLMLTCPLRTGTDHVHEPVVDEPGCGLAMAGLEGVGGSAPILSADAEPRPR